MKRYQYPFLLFLHTFQGTDTSRHWKLCYDLLPPMFDFFVYAQSVTYITIVDIFKKRTNCFTTVTLYTLNTKQLQYRVDSAHYNRRLAMTAARNQKACMSQSFFSPCFWLSWPLLQKTISYLHTNKSYDTLWFRLGARYIPLRSFPAGLFPYVFFPLGHFTVDRLPASYFPRRFFFARSFPQLFFPRRYVLCRFFLTKKSTKRNQTKSNPT